MTVLVTGGSGLVGSHVIEALRERGEPVRALVRERSRAMVERLGAEAVVGDLNDRVSWVRAADGARAIVHAAALVAQRATFERFTAVNVEGTRRAVETARLQTIPLVHISSVAVYGRSAVHQTQPREVDEDFPFGPLLERDFYARSKRAAEEVVRVAAADGSVRATAIRPDVIYGERDRLFTPRMLRALRLPLVPLVGDGSNHLACVYAGNVASAVVAALDAPAPGFRAYNVTHDAPPLLTCSEFLEAFSGELGRTLRMIAIPRALARAAVIGWSRLQQLRHPRGSAGIGRTAITFLGGDNPYSSARIARELAWEPRWDARAAIRRTVHRIWRQDDSVDRHSARDEARAL